MYRLLPILLIISLLGCKSEDTRPPVIFFTSPTDDQIVFEHDSIDIEIEAIDNVKVIDVKLLLDEQEVYSFSLAPYRYFLNTSELVGEHSLKAIATDPSGNIGQSLEILITVKTNGKPTAHFVIDPVFGISNTDFMVNSSTSFDHEDQVQDLQFRWDWTTDGEWDTQYSSVSEYTHTFTHSGTYNITLEVTDSHGNTSKTTSPFIVKGLFKDPRDGNCYQTVLIGGKTWFAENLNYAKNGWCYEENENYCDKYGRLYTWKEAINNCPEGWHLSSDEDWMAMERGLGMDESLLHAFATRESGEVGKKLKTRNGWNGTKVGDDLYGFSVLPSGYINHSTGIQSYGKEEFAGFWNSTKIENPQMLTRSFSKDIDGIVRIERNDNSAISVRCVQGISDPVVMTKEISHKSYTTITAGFEVLTGGGAKTIDVGLCWSTMKNPTIEDRRINLGMDVGEYEGTISGLVPNQTYYIRSYARTSDRVAYGNQLTVSTPIALRPLIKKLGTINTDIVETSPVVFNNKLYRLEYLRIKTEHNPTALSYFHFIDQESGLATPAFGHSYHLGSAFIHNDSVYVSVSNDWGGDQVLMFVSSDLITWEKRLALHQPDAKIYNTSICKADDEFVMMYEIGEPQEEAGQAFTARFATSKDLINWEATAPECIYAKDRYTAPHALRYYNGYYYNFYLEGIDEFRAYQTYVVRSRDLINWIQSPLNPVLMSSMEDKIIASNTLSAMQIQKIKQATNINNSDIDFCEYQGRLIINYSWGDQLGSEFLSLAVFEGSLEEFLEGWFIY